MYSTGAANIKNIKNPSIAKTSYNKNYFKSEINFASLLSDVERNEYKQLCLSEQMDSPHGFKYPSFDVSLVDNINKLLVLTIPEMVTLSGIDSEQKKNFALEGMKVHDRNVDKTCAFCGGLLTEDRWNDLGKLLDKNLEIFQREARDLKEQIDQSCRQWEKSYLIDEKQYYSAFSDQIEILNSNACNLCQKVEHCLKDASDKLEKRIGQPFRKFDEVPIPKGVTENLQKLQNDFDQLRDENLEYAKSLTERQEEAKRKLRFDEIYTQLQNLDYEHKKIMLKFRRQEFFDAEKEVKKVENDLQNLQHRKNILLKSTVSKETAANRINAALKFLGDNSFELRLNNAENGVNGYYKIYSNNLERSVSTLSTGERNLVAFLYFMQKVEENKNAEKLLVIVDDPMDSNDEASQYVMYSYLKFFADKAFFQKPNRVFVLLSHSVHFLLNARPYTWKPNNKKIHCYRLNKGSSSTRICLIKDEKDDFKTSYDVLWQELRFAYDNNEPGLMWNPLRRILDSYSDFNGVDNLDAIASSKMQAGEPFDVEVINALTMKKNEDVNSHGLFDATIDTNGISRERIMDMTKWYFKQVGGEAHFECFWRMDREDDEA